MPALKILYRSSLFAGRTVELEQPVVTLGRDPATCDVLFDEVADRVVSRQHARLVWEGATLVMEPLPGKVVLRDKVILNGPTQVRPGDVFELAGAGGPAVEVQFDAPAGSAHKPDLDNRFPFTDRDLRLPAALPLLPPEEAEAPTARSLRPVPSAASVVVAPPDAVTDPEAAAWTPPSPEQHTMMLPALDPDPLGASTRFLRVDELQPPPPAEGRKRTFVAVGAGVAVAVLVVGGFLGWQAWSRADAERRAADRVERLREAFKDLQRPPGLSDEDWETYALEKQAEKQAQKKAQPVARPAPVAADDAFALPPEEDEPPPPPPPEETTDLRAEARALFATLRRLELERLSLGRTREATRRREQIDLEAKQGRAAYEALVHKVLEEPGAQQQAVLTAARYLGECDVTLPASLLTQALAAARSLATQGRAELEAQLARAKDNRYTPTITAALGDQGLPLELFVLPLRASGFDAMKVGDAGAQGIPKGMWQLSPQAATRHLLTVGPQVVQAAFDPSDDRHRYEKETKAAAKAARALYAGPAAGSALLVLTFWGHGDEAELLAARARAGLSPTEQDPARVSLSRLWEKNALGAHRQQAVEALATVAVTSFPKAFGLGFAPPFAHVEPENRR